MSNNEGYKKINKVALWPKKASNGSDYLSAHVECKCGNGFWANCFENRPKKDDQGNYLPVNPKAPKYSGTENVQAQNNSKVEDIKNLRPEDFERIKKQIQEEEFRRTDAKTIVEDDLPF